MASEAEAMDLNQLFGLCFPMPTQGAAGNIFPFTGAFQGHTNMDLAMQQQRLLAQDYRPVPVPTPEERKQSEIEWKNQGNYARWLARILRDPLQDVPYR